MNDTLISPGMASSTDTNCIHILVFKTNIRFKKDVRVIGTILDKHDAVIKWNIDLADIDNVLRIESTTSNSSAIIDTITNTGFFCQELY